MFYDDHYVFPRPWTQAQEAPGVPGPVPVAVLYGPNRASQPFVSGVDRLSMVELWLAGPEDTTVSVSISADDGITYLGDVDLAAGIPGAYFRLAFPSIPESRGRSFWLTLSAPGATMAQPVLTRSVGGDRLGGGMWLNEYSRPGNMEIYTYSRGFPGRWWLDALGEQLLPGIFRLRVQQYKPVPFKGALFPALMVGTAVLSLLFLMLARPSGQTMGRSAGWGISGLLLGFLVWQLGTGRVRLPSASRITELRPGSAPLAISPPAQQNERLANDLALILWTAQRLPEPRFLSTQLLSGLPAIRVPGESRIAYPMTLPLNGRLRAAVSVVGEGSMRFTVKLGEYPLWEETMAAADEPLWLDLDLSSWGGTASSIILLTQALEGEPQGAWLMPQLTVSSTWLLSDPLPSTVEYKQVAYTFANDVELLGYATQPLSSPPGDSAEVTLFWRVNKPVDADATVFVHLLDEEGQIVTQHDAQPVSNTYPISIWQPGAIVVDRHALTLPPELPVSQFTLAVGLYTPDDLVLWPVSTADGEPLPNGRVLLPYTVGDAGTR
jgi:hypothetical protein